MDNPDTGNIRQKTQNKVNKTKTQDKTKQTSNTGQTNKTPTKFKV
jgi:hypothetical protein